MTLLRLLEHRTTEHVRLDRDQATALGASGLVDVTPGVLAGSWDLRARSTVGAASVAGLDLLIEPKLPIRRVMALLGYASSIDIFRDEPAAYTEDLGLVEAMAVLLARAGERALAAGLLQGYRVEEAAAMVVRGRIDLTRQLVRRHGIPLPVEIRYDEFDVDIAENRILRAAIQLMLATPGIRAAIRHRLAGLLARLADVSNLVLSAPLPPWQPTRLNARYVPALRLAEMVLARRSVELGAASATADGVLIDMAKVFEDFLTVTLTQRLEAVEGRCRAQSVWWLDEADVVKTRPDLVWTGANGAPRAVVDAKYKASDLPNADYYQLIAYCTRLGLSEGHLVSAAGHRPVRSSVMRVSGILLHEHSIDLDQPMPGLLTSVDILAQRIAG